MGADGQIDEDGRYAHAGARTRAASNGGAVPERLLLTRPPRSAPPGSIAPGAHEAHESDARLPDAPSPDDELPDDAADGSRDTLGEHAGPGYPEKTATYPGNAGTETAVRRTNRLEPAAALLGWLALTALGAAGFVSGLVHRSLGGSLPWLGVLLAGSLLSVVLAARRGSARAVNRLLSEVHARYPLCATDEGESPSQADEYLSELIEKTAGFVGARAAGLYVVEGGRRVSLRSWTGRDPTSTDTRVAVDRAIAEAGPTSTPSEDHREVVLSAPLVIGDRVTGVLVASAPRRWSKTSRLPRLQLIADGAAAVIEQARLLEEERRNRLGAAHARGHLAILARAAVTLSAGVESTEEALCRLVEVVVPDFADWAAVHLESEGGEASKIEVGSGADHIHPDGPALVRSAMVTGGAVVSSDLAAGSSGPDRTSSESQTLRLTHAPPARGIGSLMIIPVEINGKPVGALSFANFPERRGFRPSDLETAVILAGTVAAATERLALFRQGLSLSESADRRTDRLRRLVETALVASTPLGEREVLEVLAEHARQVLACERVVVAHRRYERTVEVSCPPEPSPAELSAVRRATERVLGGSRSAKGAYSQMGVSSLQARDDLVSGDQPAGPHWVAAPVDQANGSAKRAIVALGDGADPFDPDDEAVLALLSRMASIALERAALYETLRSNEQRLTVLVESSPLAIAELDLDGSVRWWNRAAGYLFGWDENGPAPRSIPVTGESAEMMATFWQRARLGKATVGALVPARRPSGELMELSLSVAPLRENDGSTGGILAVAEDATEREQVLEQFHRAQRLGAMARLAGGIAHDFNNLVTVILGSSEALMKRVGPNDPLRAEVEAINRVGKRAAVLTSRLLQIGHRSSFQLSETDPSDVIAAMTDDLRRLVGSHIEVEVTREGPDEQLLVLVDRAELERALFNLAFNARDAMPQGGRLVIDTRLEREEAGSRSWVVISVSDTGIGMDPGTAEHCFEPFFTTKGTRSGTGLGLATVHAMVTQSNGTVNVESTPGVGTTFTLKFPVAAGAGSRDAEAQASKR